MHLLILLLKISRWGLHIWHIIKMSHLIPCCWLLQGGNEDYKSQKLRIKTVSSSALIKWNTCQVKKQNKKQNLFCSIIKEWWAYQCFWAAAVILLNWLLAWKLLILWKVQYLGRKFKSGTKSHPERNRDQIWPLVPAVEMPRVPQKVLDSSVKFLQLKKMCL